MELKPELIPSTGIDPVGRAHAIYAAWLNAGVRFGLALLTGTFFVYAFEVLEPHVPIERLPDLWLLPAPEFSSLTGAPTGWGWLALIGRGDYLTYVGIAALSLTSIACFVRVVATWIAGGERVSAAIGIAQIVVFAFAASGILVDGH